MFSRVADVGRSVVVTHQEAGWIMSSNLMRISLDPSLTNPCFTRASIVYRETTKQQIRQFVNSGGRDVANTPIMNSHDFLLRTEEAQLAKLRLLKAGLMDDLLSGRVRVPEGLTSST